MRKAFSMITAIFIILLMATVAAFILNISAKTVKETVYQHRHEQAILLAKSYTELAIMYASANESNVTNCAENITGAFGSDPANGDGYSVEVKIAYIGPIAPSTNPIVCTSDRILNTTDIVTGDKLQIIVDVFVRYRDTDVIGALGAGSTPWTTYHRRTLQGL